MADHNEEPEITLDDVLNTGVGTDRNVPEPTPKEDSTPKPEDTPSPVSEEEQDKGNEDDKSNKEKLQNLFIGFSNEEEVEENKKQLRSRLISQYKGTNFDANGNIVNEQGEVVASFDDLYDYITEEKVVKDDAGNIVDEEGNVVKSAYEVAVEETVVNSLHDNSPYQFVDENGTPKIYTDDDKGFQEFANDVAGERFEEFKEAYFNSNPLIKDVVMHLAAGNDLESFREPFDYSSLDVTALSTSEKLELISRSFAVKGVAREQIEPMMQMIKDGNQIDSQVLVAIPALQAHEDTIEQNREQQYLESVEAQNQKVEAYWNEMEQVVNTGVLSDNVSIPDNEKQAFFSYISDAVDDSGNSQDMLDSVNEKAEQKLLVSYLRYKGFDLSSLVKVAARENRVKSLKQLIKESANLSNNPVNDSSKASVTSGEVDITIDTLLS